MAPVTPHVAEELWALMGKGGSESIHTQPWPSVDEAATKEDEMTIVVQVNGKLRDRIVVSADADEATVKAAALATEGVIKALEGREPKKVIVVPGKLVSVVV